MGEFEPRANVRNCSATLIATAGLLLFSLSAARAQEKLIFSPWQKICYNQVTSGQRPFCNTAASVSSDEGSFKASVVFYESDQNVRLFRVVVPANGGRPATVAINSNQALTASLVKCENEVCINDYKAADAFISQLKSGKSLTVRGLDVRGKPFSHTFSLTDFRMVAEGPGLDAREVEAQQKRLQEDLEKRAAAMRKKMEQEETKK